MKKILLFSEEYQKVTNGMSNVWSSFARNLPDNFDCTILLNFEHWMNDDLSIVADSINKRKLKIPIFSSIYYIVKKKFNPQRKSSKFIIYLISKIIEPIQHIIIFLFLVYLFKRNKYAVIYSHNGGWPGGSICRYIILAAYLTRVPTRVLVIHSHPVNSSIIVIRLLNKLKAKILSFASTNIVTVSESVKEKLIFEFKESKISVIYNGFDKINYNSKNLLNSDLNITRERSTLTIGFLGALYYHKGAHILIESSKYMKNLRKVNFLLGGPKSEEYKNYLMKISIKTNHKIIFLDYVYNVQEFYRNIDMLIVPSISYESFGMVILEAMYNKLPVICSNFGGMKEIVVDEVTGLIFENENSLHLAQCIDFLESNPKVSSYYGKNGYDRLASNFDVKFMVEKYINLIQ
jgi:teichuronic acid biosynthesis glycosyltransferase TuaC